MKTNKAEGLDCTITAEAPQGGGDAMADACYPLLLCWSVLKSDTTWPVDHQRLSAQEGWPKPYDQL